MSVDGTGSVYLAGSTSLGLFPISGAAQNDYGGGSTDAFVCKLNASGSAIVYATFLGGGDADVANGVAVDALGAAYGAFDAFVTKLGAAGGLAYATIAPSPPPPMPMGTSASSATRL